MIRIEVASTSQVDEKAGISKKTGKNYHMREQSCYAYTLDKDGKPGKYPVPMVVGIEDGEQPYGVGMYQPDPRSLYVGDFGKLMMGRLRLVPLTAKQ